MASGCRTSAALLQPGLRAGCVRAGPLAQLVARSRCPGFRFLCEVENGALRAVGALHLLCHHAGQNRTHALQQWEETARAAGSVEAGKLNPARARAAFHAPDIQLARVITTECLAQACRRPLGPAPIDRFLPERILDRLHLRAACLLGIRAADGGLVVFRGPPPPLEGGVLAQ